MTNFELAYARSNLDPGYGGTVSNRLVELKTYLNNNISGHSFSFFSFGEVPFNASNYSPTPTGKRNFLKDCLVWLDDEFYLFPHSSICIAIDHINLGFNQWGYGFSSSFTIDGKPVNGCYVHANSIFLPQIDVRMFSWHEPMHQWTSGGPLSDHASGTFQYILDNSFIVGITPLATGYVQDQNGNGDTMYPNTHPAQDPSVFCGGVPKGQGMHLLIGDNHDPNSLSTCTVSHCQQELDNI